MLYKKFQQIKSEIDLENYSLARKLLEELEFDESSKAAKALHSALLEKLPHSDNNPSQVKIEQIEYSYLSDMDSQTIKPGISIVSCCMNRNENLLKALKTWVKLPVDEIVIVDWSSNTPVCETIKEFNDARIKVLRVENESKWILTYGFNVGLRFASYSKIIKLDADIEVTPSFIFDNSFSKDSYIRGNWKSAVESIEGDQKFVNGSFGAMKESLRKVGYYNEFIRTYGWDDSDIYNRLSTIAGCKTKFINPNSIVHLKQEQEERLKYQSVNLNMFLGQFEPTEYYNLCNKYLTSLFDVWDCKFLQQYTVNRLEGNLWKLERMTENIDIPHHIVKDAEKYATLQISSWVSPNLWKSLSTNPSNLERVKAHFKKQSQKEQVLADIEQMSNTKLQTKWRGECLLNLFKNGITIGFPIECEGLQIPLNVKYRGFSFHLNPLTSLPFLTSRLFHCNENTTVIAKRVFVTSLYDEKRQDRLEEYLYCIEENLKVFDVLVLYYEDNDGSLYKELETRFANGESWEKIIFVIYKGRPTFEFLFDTTDLLFPNDIICVANADIAADNTIKKVNEHIHDDSFWVLSRYEVDPTTKDPEGLIMNQLGIPNTFSADMWIYKSPRKYKFKANFPIGSFHCDSFINYYAGRSSYKIYNPCLDINIYHVHDPIFNSSQEKAIRDKQIIEDKLKKEVDLNDGVVPLKGVKWCKLESCRKESKYHGTLDWYNTLAKVHVNDDGTNLFQVFIAVYLLKEAFDIVNCKKSIWIILPETQRNSFIYSKVESFIILANLDCVYIGVDDKTRIEFNEKVYSQSDIDTVDIVNTVELVREKKPGKFFDFSHETYIKGDFFGLDSDIAYLVNYQPKTNDIESYQLLKLLSENQIVNIQEVICRDGFGDIFWPYKSDLEALNNAKEDEYISRANPQVSFITSIYKGAEFMRGYLENIAACAKECNGEVIIVDANSPQQEHEIFMKFIADYPDYEKYFTYYKLDQDPGLYNCWKYAIERCNSRYVSNANLDDRRSPFQARVLLESLYQTPNMAGAAAGIRATKARNTSWYTATDNQYWFTHGYDDEIEFSSLYLTDEKGHIKSQNIMHCMPIWKKSLHDKYGYFDEEKYGTSADWAFWLECTNQGEKFLLVPQVLSQYYINEQSHNRVNDPNGIKENRIIADYIGIEQSSFQQQ